MKADNIRASPKRASTPSSRARRFSARRDYDGGYHRGIAARAPAPRAPDEVARYGCRA